MLIDNYHQISYPLDTSSYNHLTKINDYINGPESPNLKQVMLDLQT